MQPPEINTLSRLDKDSRRRTNTGLQRTYYSEPPLTASRVVYGNELWVDADVIPTSGGNLTTVKALANTSTYIPVGYSFPVIRRHIYLNTSLVAGTYNTFSAAEIVSCIPGDFTADFAYQPRIYRASYSTEIPFSQLQWELNSGAGTIKFNGTRAQIETALGGAIDTHAPLISFWRYIGEIGSTLIHQIKSASNAALARSGGTMTGDINMGGNALRGIGSIISDVAITGNMVLTGNLTVTGTQIIANTETVTIADNIIQLNSALIGAPSFAALSGVQLYRGTSPSTSILFRELDEAWVLGEEGSMQSIATREDEPTNKGVSVWDSVAIQFKTYGALAFDPIALRLTISGNSESTSTTTGALVVTGGIGTQRNIYARNVIKTTSAITTTGGTTTLFSTANGHYIFTGSLSHSVTLPPSATVGIGWLCEITNDSSSTITINATSASQTVTTLIAGMHATFICGTNSGTDASGDWIYHMRYNVRSSANLYTLIGDATGSGGSVVYSTAPTIASPTYTGTLSTPLTSGSVALIDASGRLNQENSYLFWDANNKRLGVNTNTPSSSLHVDGGVYVSETATLGSATMNGTVNMNNNNITNVGSISPFSTNPLTVSGNLTVTGNLTVQGTHLIANTETVTIEDNVIQLNSAATGAPSSLTTSGIELFRGTAPAMYILFRELDETWVLGESNSMQAIATREDSPTNMGVGVWDFTALKFKTYGAFTYNPSTSNVAITSTSESTSRTSGALTIGGGLGCVGTIHARNLVKQTIMVYTSGGSTILSATTAGHYIFKGTLAHTVSMPVATTVGLGWNCELTNGSSGNITITTNEGQTITTLIPGMHATVTCSNDIPAGVLSDWTYHMRYNIRNSASLHTLIGDATGSAGVVVYSNTPTIASPIYTGTLTTPLTTGSIAFIGSALQLTEDNTNFYWNDTDNRLGIRTNAPTAALHVVGDAVITTSATIGSITMTGNIGMANNNITGVNTITGHSTNPVAIDANVTISGNLTVSGTQVILNTETVTIEDNIIQLNSAAIGEPSSLTTSGIQLYRGSSPAMNLLFRESDQAWVLGATDSMQAIATREDTPVNTGVAVWDASALQFKTYTQFIYNRTNGQAVISDNTVSTNQTTGALVVTGGGGFGGSVYAANVIKAVTQVTTNATTTTINSTSNGHFIFTGTATQIVTLPATTSIGRGWVCEITNNSTNTITVNADVGSQLVTTIIAGMHATFTCNTVTGNSLAADWTYHMRYNIRNSASLYTLIGDATGSGGSVVYANSPTIASPTYTGTLTTPLTSGSIPFINASLQLSQNNSSLFWDSANARLGVGTAIPSTTLHLSSLLSNTVPVMDNISTVTSYALYLETRGVNNSTSAGIAFGDSGNVRASIIAYDDGISARNGFLLNTFDGTTLNRVLRITSSQRVGINVTTPLGNLHVSSLNNLTTVTNAYNTYISGPPTSASTFTITNAYSLFIASGGASDGTVTNSYGLYVNAPTAGTNRYAGTFIGGNVGVGTASPTSLLSVNPTVVNAGSFNHSGAPVTITQSTPSTNTVLNDRLPVLHLCREGTNTQAFGQRSTFALSRYEHPGTSASRTQLDIQLAHASYDTVNVLSMRSDGNIGIGTTSPTQKLDVVGNITLSGGYRNIAMQGGNSIGYIFGGYDNFIEGLGGLDGIKIGYNFCSDNSSFSYPALAGSTSMLNIGYGTFGFYTGPSQTVPTEKMTLVQSGSLGIGTTSPNAKLHLVNNDGIDSLLVNHTGGNFRVNSIGWMYIRNVEFATNGDDIYIRANNSSIWLQPNQSVFPSYFTSSEISLGSDTVRIRSTGNVGIGTTVPVTRLHINGALTVDNSTIEDTNNTTAINAVVDTWGLVTTPGTSGWSGVCWSPELNLFCAVGSATLGSPIVTSPTALTWTIRAATATMFYDVCWSSELMLFCAVGSDLSVGFIATSTDGITWTARTSPQPNLWGAVCWSPQLGLFAAVSSSGTNRLMTSSDGITWGIIASVGNTIGWADICWSPQLGRFCAISGTSSDTLTSSNGTTWTVTAMGTGIAYTAITWSPQLLLFCAVSTNGTTQRIATSVNGTTWVVRTAPNTPYTDIAWSPELGLFCAVSNPVNSTIIVTSPDGINWTTRNFTTQNSWSGICWSPQLGIFCAVASSGTSKVARSTARPGQYYDNNAFNANSAHVQVDTNTKGILLPRMTTVQKNAIVYPQSGLAVYDTTLKKMDVYSERGWDRQTCICKLRGATQSIAHNVGQSVLWSLPPMFYNNYTDFVDTANTFKILFPSVGFYSITSILCFASGITINNNCNQGYEICQSNGTTVEYANTQSGSGCSSVTRNSNTSIVFISSVTHYLRIVAFQDSGSAKALTNSATDTTTVTILKL